MNSTAEQPGPPAATTPQEPQVGDIVLVAVALGYVMKVLAIEPTRPEPYRCCTFPDASYRWETPFARADLYAVLVRADGTVVADPESLPMRVLASMHQTRSCVMVYEKDPPWAREPGVVPTGVVIHASPGEGPMGGGQAGEQSGRTAPWETASSCPVPGPTTTQAPVPQPINPAAQGVRAISLWDLYPDALA